jgi:hypothetical protein
MSDLKSVASRENGARSTGPVTPEGRERSSQNAITHGIFAGRRFLTEEDPAEFKQLFEALTVEFQAEGYIETSYVHRIAMTIFQQRRLDCAEVAAIELARTEYEYSPADVKWSELSPLLATQVHRLAPKDLEAMQRFRDDLATQARSIPKDDAKFHRIRVGLDRGFERLVRALRQEQAARRSGADSILVKAPSRSSGNRNLRESAQDTQDAVVLNASGGA